MTSRVVNRGYRWLVRASRLVGLLSLLQARGRMSASQLARELEVSQRTVLRDIEALSTAGFPVYATRGCRGGFELLDGFSGDLPASGYGHRRGSQPAAAGTSRARVRISPRGLRLAALLGRPSVIRIRKNADTVAGRRDWAQAWVRIDPAGSAVLDMLALGAEVEVLHPPELRGQVGETARKLAGLYAGR
jgi:predicted DNA-binding transcriptional regulator YafY